jgi:predicted lipoprotein with Yx(FWY)xxD motif
MTDRNPLEQHPRRPRPRILALGLVPLAVAGALLVSSASAGSNLTLKGSVNSKLGKTVVVNPAGMTLYSLTPATTHHLLCTSRECLKVWPPLTVSSSHVKLQDGAGVHGTLSTIHRSNGQIQVTLRGMPLYRFSGDSAPHQANGEGLQSFGGTWHAVTAASGSSSSGTASPAPSAPSSTSGGSGAW